MSQDNVDYSVSAKIINTFGKDQLARHYNYLGDDDFRNSLKRAFKKEFPNYRLSWGAWRNICNAVIAKIGVGA